MKGFKSSSIVIFHHIPKAGGSILSNSLANNFHPAQVFRPQAATKWERLAAFESWLRGPRGYNLGLVLGHMPFGVHRILAPRPCTYVGFVREPVGRVISLVQDIYRRKEHYLHEALHIKLREGGVEGVLSADFSLELNNEISRYLNDFPEDSSIDCLDYAESALSNVKNYFSVMGLTEFYDESMVLLQEKLGLPCIYYSRINVKHGVDLKFEERHVAMIREMNQVDKLLYDRLKEDFVRETEQIPNFQAKVEDFRKRNSRWGWIQYKSSRFSYRIRSRFARISG